MTKKKGLQPGQQDFDEPATVDDVIIENAEELKQQAIANDNDNATDIAIASARVAALLAGPAAPSEPAKPPSPLPEAPALPRFEVPTPELLSESESIPALDEIPTDALVSML